MGSCIDLGRQALRSALRHPLYSAFAILTLAAAIGGGTLMLSLYDAIAFRALPVREPSELVSVRRINTNAEGRSMDLGRFSLAELEEMRAVAAPVADLGGFALGESVLRAGNRTERSEVQWVDSRYFEILGVPPVHGRGFVPSDARENRGAGGVVITEATWERLFGRDARITDRTIEVDGVPQPVLGVVPAAFRGFEVGADPALFALAADAPETWAFFRLFARMREGASIVALETLLAGAHEAIRAREPERQSFMIVDGKSSAATERIEVVDGSRGESALRGEATLPVALVGGLLALVLVVLAANLANLLAVRALAERRAAAVRLALGAPRAVLAGGWIAESLLLTFTGTALGVALVAAAGDALLDWTPLPPWTQGLSVAIDLRTIAVAFGLALALALLVGGLAAWENTRIAPEMQLREEDSHTTHSRGRARWRNVLIASQVALSVVLLVAMGLFARSTAALLDIDTGFPLDRVATFRLDVPESLADRASGAIERFRDELARMPGIAAAGYSVNPVLGGVRGYSMGTIEGYRPKDGEVMMLNTMTVSPGFFGALDMPLVSGRPFDELDRQRTSRGVVVNTEFVERYFDGRDPVGRRISFNFMRASWAETDPNDLAIVGVVADRTVSDVREEPTPRIYPLAKGPVRSVVFYVRSPDAPMRLAPAIERLARERIPEAAAGPVRTLADHRDRSLRRELLTRDLTLVFGLLAAALAALGLFAVVSHAVGERTRELGLRQALGASPARLSRQVIAEGLVPVVWGLAAGLTIAAASARLVTSQLYGVTARDPLAFVGAVALMALVAVAACVPAAIRASRIDPARALRAG